MKGIRSLVIFAGLALAATGNSIVVFSGTSGSLGAEASFTIVNGVLTLELTNTSTNDSSVPADLLSSVFWNMTSSPTLAGVHATLGFGSSIFLNGAASTPSNLDDFFAYRDDISGLTLESVSRAYGVSSSGFGVFGPKDLFHPDVQNQPDGMDYNILSASDNVTTGNSPLLDRSLVKNSVVFTFEVGQGVSESWIQDVYFQYGTSWDEPGFEGSFEQQGVPVAEPLTFGIAGAGLAMALRRRRTNR